MGIDTQEIENAYNAALAEKIFAAEKNIALLRLFTVLFNIFGYFFLMDEAIRIPSVAYPIMVVAPLYSLFIIFFKPYKKYPVFLAGYFTYLSDAILITLWLWGTGGFYSPFFLLWYLSLVAVAFRFSYKVTISTSFIYSFCYIILVILLGQYHVEVVIRIGYIFLIGVLGALISRETLTQTKEKILMRNLAEEAQRAEGKLKIQTNLYESMLKLQSEVGEGVSITDGAKITYANDALCKIYGYTQEEIYALPSFMELIEPEQRQIMIDRFAKRSAGAEDLPDNGETIIINKNGSKVNISYVMKRIDHNNPIKLFTIIRDITNRKIEEENLIRLASIVESSEDAIIYKSLDYKILNWNHGAERLYGYTPEEAIGQPTTLVVPPELLIEEMELIGRIINGEFINHYETIRKHKNGSDIDVSLSLSLVRDGTGKIKGYSTIARDISDRKKSEAMLLQKSRELAQSNAELETFAFAASHDLQEPLRKIRLLSDLFSEKYMPIIDDEGRTFIEKIQNASSRMQNLINDVLSLSRLNKSAGTFESTNLNDIVRLVLVDLEVSINQKNATIQLDTLPTIKAIPFQIGQLFQNLLSNAIKYVKKDVPPVIQIRSEIVLGSELEEIEGVLKSKKYCRIFIQDNGIGFDQKYAEKIFIPFQRLHGRDDYEGTGIGLAICKKIIENHQGAIYTESKPGQGALFIIMLPV